MMNTVSKKRFVFTKKAKDYIFVACVLAFPICQFLLFWVYVNFSSIMMAFQSPVDGGFSMTNFLKFFDAVRMDREFDSKIMISIRNTFLLGFVTNFINIPLTVFATYLLFKKFRGSTAFRIIFYLPAIISEVVAFTLQSYMLDANGPVLALAQALGIHVGDDLLQSGLLGLSSTAFPSIMVISLAIAGGTIVLLTGSLTRVPESVYESAKLEGCGMGREFICIALPLIWPSVSTIWVFAIAGSFGSYMNIMMLTGGNYNTSTFGWFMMNHTLNASQGNGSFNYPAAIGLLLTCIVAPITLLLKKLAEKITGAVEY